MIHRYCRTGFDLVSAHPLLELYSILVVVEISLKDNSPNWPTGHNVPALLAPIDPALSVQLATALTALRCTGKSGNPENVPAHSYPYMRYLRHHSDFVGETSDIHINQALDLARDVRAKLKALGLW